MKRIILLCGFSLAMSISYGQEWFTSFDAAKNFALVQNKMLFVLWEDSFQHPIPILANSDKGNVVVINLSKDDSLDAIIWEYFVPVKLSESYYVDFVNEAKDRGFRYLDKLNDDSIKIMDINGNILNLADTSDGLPSMSSLIKSYALNTLFLKPELESYSKEKNFTTALRLAIKYIDFAIFANERLRPEIIDLANIYLDESKKILLDTNSENYEEFSQKIELIQIKELLVLNQYKKAHRKIKRIDGKQIMQMNESLFEFLNYTVFKLLKDEANAEVWKSKISLLNLKKAELILNNHKNARFN